jgi:hypothetical protein
VSPLLAGVPHRISTNPLFAVRILFLFVSDSQQPSILAQAALLNYLPDLRYARAFFPALAALLYSGYIKARDIIDLPLPHPEAWVQTVAYVYTGQGELTEAIEENILYLGGKV